MARLSTDMSIIEIDNLIKSLSKERLQTELESPTGHFPLYLIAGRLKEMESMEADAQAAAAEKQTSEQPPSVAHRLAMMQEPVMSAMAGKPQPQPQQPSPAGQAAQMLTPTVNAARGTGGSVTSELVNEYLAELKKRKDAAQSKRLNKEFAVVDRGSFAANMGKQPFGKGGVPSEGGLADLIAGAHAQKDKRTDPTPTPSDQKTQGKFTGGVSRRHGQMVNKSSETEFDKLLEELIRRQGKRGGKTATANEGGYVGRLPTVYARDGSPDFMLTHGSLSGPTLRWPYTEGEVRRGPSGSRIVGEGADFGRYGVVEGGRDLGEMSEAEIAATQVLDIQIDEARRNTQLGGDMGKAARERLPVLLKERSDKMLAPEPAPTAPAPAPTEKAPWVSPQARRRETVARIEEGPVTRNVAPAPPPPDSSEARKIHAQQMTETLNRVAKRLDPRAVSAPDERFGLHPEPISGKDVDPATAPSAAPPGPVLNLPAPITSQPPVPVPFKEKAEDVFTAFDKGTTVGNLKAGSGIGVQKAEKIAGNYAADIKKQSQQYERILKDRQSTTSLIMDAINAKGRTAKEQLESLESSQKAINDFTETGKLPKARRDRMINNMLMTMGASLLGNPTMAKALSKGLLGIQKIQAGEEDAYAEGLSENLDAAKKLGDLRIKISDTKQQGIIELAKLKNADSKFDHKAVQQHTANLLKLKQLEETAKYNFINASANKINAEANQFKAINDPKIAVPKEYHKSQYNLYMAQYIAALGKDKNQAAADAVTQSWKTWFSIDPKTGILDPDKPNSKTFAPLLNKDSRLKRGSGLTFGQVASQKRGSYEHAVKQINNWTKTKVFNYGSGGPEVKAALDALSQMPRYKDIKNFKTTAKLDEVYKLNPSFAEDLKRVLRRQYDAGTWGSSGVSQSTPKAKVDSSQFSGFQKVDKK